MLLANPAKEPYLQPAGKTFVGQSMVHDKICVL